MLVFEYKLKGKAEQYRKVDEAIRTGQFIPSSCLKYWQENKGTTKNDLQKHYAALAANPEFPWAKKLYGRSIRAEKLSISTMILYTNASPLLAPQAHADRAWFAISQFFKKCSPQVPGKKGYPKFKKHSRSVEYKRISWKLSGDRKHLTITDGFEAEKFKLIGSRDLHFYDIKQIKRIRLIKRADGYYAQFCIDVERRETTEYTGLQVGIDVGLSAFYTDSNGQKVDNPDCVSLCYGYLKAAERRLKKLQRRMSKRYANPKKEKKGERMSKTKAKQSNRFHKARIQECQDRLNRWNPCQV